MNHRCAGRMDHHGLMKGGFGFLDATHKVRAKYEAPAQDLRIDFAAPSGLPRSRFVIDKVREHM